jgi:hypothetical protein
MGKDYTPAYFAELLNEAQDKCASKAPGIKSSRRKDFVDACELFHDAFEAQQKATTNEELAESAEAQQNGMKKCVKAANKIFEKLDMLEHEKMEGAVLKGSIIVKATPDGLAAFCEKDKKNGKLIDHLLKSNALMKEMLTNGGASGGNYGNAMKIYTKILASLPEEDDDFSVINRKLGLAVALELATPIFEFDTKVEIDPIKRYHHYSTAFKNGELDPAFPHFSAWEMRHIVNCDAPDAQIKWGRDMMMNYAPYITTITDIKKRYLYILETDVLIRSPNWTSSPRTYQQVLSGGGKDGPNAWFARFICKAFGIPTWGCKQPGRHCLTRWTPTGWEAMQGANWDSCAWAGVSGIDFKGEADARSACSDEDYYKKLVLLDSLAEVVDARRGELAEEEKTILHPHRLWRSLSIIQKALMLEPASADQFERSGKSPVKTNVEKYLEMFEADADDTKVKKKSGKVVIPAAAHGYTNGPTMDIPNFKGGKQLNLLADGSVEFEIPENIETKTWTLELEVCSVHLKQTPIRVVKDEVDVGVIEPPYTAGEWDTTPGFEVELSGGTVLRFIRERPAFGLAVRKLILS